MRVAHLFPAFRDVGGVQTVLRHHHAGDASCGIDSRFVIYFEDDSETIERVAFLGLKLSTTVRTARQRFAAALADFAPEVAVYHGPWGLPYFADIDRTARRLLLLHGRPEGIEATLRARSGFFDGAACVNNPLRELVGDCLQELGHERITVLPTPIAPKSLAGTRTPLSERPLVIGYCGRLIREDKRADLLPPFIRALDAAGLDYRLEILGDGPEQAALAGAWAGNPRVAMHGFRSGDDYWRILGSWDVIVFTSEREGTPIGLLEAMSLGVLPLFPRINTGGDEYTEQTMPELLYAPKDFAGAARVLERVAGLPENEIVVLRARARAAVSRHLGDGYLREFAAFARWLIERPRISRVEVANRPAWTERLSFRTLRGLGAARRTGLRLFGRV